jgi:thiamine pyrophosphate-dependent acetolactate synthase large subunit-like protein
MLYGRTFGTEMGQVRWDQVAIGLGCEGIYVEDAEELAAAFARARYTAARVVVCDKTNRDANLAVRQQMLLRFLEV